MHTLVVHNTPSARSANPSATRHNPSATETNPSATAGMKTFAEKLSRASYRDRPAAAAEQFKAAAETANFVALAF